MTGSISRAKRGRGRAGKAGRALVALALVAAAAVACASCGGSDAPSSGSPATRSPAPVQGPYAPSIDPAGFVARVDNRYFPLAPGTELRYRGVAEDGRTPQADEVIVTRRTKRILGVSCTVVRDTVSSRGRPIERTFDWYAQDGQGNVWYFGEDSRDFHNGRFVRSDGSWQAGVNEAKPGVIMEGHPRAGDAYRQEYYPGHAEDQARVLGDGGAVRVPYGSFATTLATVERTRLEPGVRERKLYAAGIGEISSADVMGSHEAFRLVAVRR